MDHRQIAPALYRAPAARPRLKARIRVRYEVVIALRVVEIDTGEGNDDQVLPGNCMRLQPRRGCTAVAAGVIVSGQPGTHANAEVNRFAVYVPQVLRPEVFAQHEREQADHNGGCRPQW